jgi:hypothetical protein
MRQMQMTKTGSLQTSSARAHNVEKPQHEQIIENETMRRAIMVPLTWFCPPRFGHLDFEFGACLEFGAWDLEFRQRNCRKIARRRLVPGLSRVQRRRDPHILDSRRNDRRR